MSDLPVDWKCVHEVRAQIGEVPTWSQGKLYWINLFEPSLSRLDLATGENRSWIMPSLIGSYGLGADDKTAVVALRSGIFRLDLASGSLEQLESAPYNEADYRFNDGRVDRAGRLWVGTNIMPDSKEPFGSAAFYRYDERGLVEKVQGMTIANGIAWSPDNKTMYLADRPNWQILAFDYDLDSGEVSNRRKFASVPEGQIPDGATVDSQGGYWIAMFAAGRIIRYNPDGSFDRAIKAPTPHPTMVAFGGPDMSTLYCTTGCYNYTDEQLREHPLAGSIFAVDGLGYHGLPEPKFAGHGN